MLGVKYEELYDVPPGGFKPNSLGSSSSHRYDSDLEVGAGNGDRRWSMWTSVRGALPRRHHNYALVPGDQHESINGGA